MSSLTKSIEDAIRDRACWMAQAVEARRLLKLLPEPVQQLEGSVDCDDKGELTIRTYGQFAKETFEVEGVVFEKAQLPGYNKRFMASANYTFDTVVVHITVFDLETPPLCRIEEEKYTATRYKAICTETGEEV